MFKVENDFISFDEDVGRVNTGAINYYELDITFNEEWEGLTTVAILMNRDTKQAVEIPVMLGKISVPYLQDQSVYTLGVIGYTINGTEKSLQVSTNLIPFYVDLGAGSITTTEQEVPETSVWEQYVATMNSILEDTDDIRNATNLIKSETQRIKDETEGYRDETKGYRDETKALKNSTQETIEEGFEELAGLAADFMGLTEEKTTDFNDNATTKTEAFNSNAIEKTEAINFIKDNVIDLKDETIGYKNEAKGSADNAKDSEEDAEQAFSDFLSTLGTDVATLTGGKLTPSQIPDLSINDVFTVADTDEMLELTAERGDVAILIPEDVVTDTYILSVDDPSVLSNWKKLGVSYVANAGHATTADDATNSEKINNKRIVGMTETQYASAVLDEDTYYMVYPD